jgi:Tol biopolymer transport system component
MMVKNLNHLGVALAAAAAGVLAAVGMLMLMLLVVVEPAGAAFPGQNGKIAFVSGFGSDSEIFTVNANGTELVRLTNNTVKDHGPAWSPDSGPIPGDNLIAFSSERPDGSDGDIYTINPLGIKVGPLTLFPTVRLTNDPAQDIFPAWSPDGNKIAFSSNRAGFHGATGDCMLGHPCNHEIYTMNADGTGLDRLTNDPVNDPAQDLNPAWSPDGKKIAFNSSRDGNREIYSMNSDGSNQINLTNDHPPQDPAQDSDPTWSPDGKKIAFTRDIEGEIYTMNADGTDLVRFTNGTEPAWSPDGKRIAFTSNRDGDSSSDIYSMLVFSEESDLDGLTNEPPGHQHQPDWQSSRSPLVCPFIFCPHQGG